MEGPRRGWRAGEMEGGGDWRGRGGGEINEMRGKLTLCGMQVPAAIKSLYGHPLPDVSGVPSVSDSLLLPEEDMEKWRMEEESDRKLFVCPRKPALTHNQDEVCIVDALVTAVS
jgi:hypothetical protein